jgi:hypothetical protein
MCTVQDLEARILPRSAVECRAPFLHVDCNTLAEVFQEQVTGTVVAANQVRYIGGHACVCTKKTAVARIRCLQELAAGTAETANFNTRTR